jgi:ABC-type lipopolysaccharide export system ATPase subunit
VIMTACERIYALESGQIIAEGTPDQIRRDPGVIASYLGGDHLSLGHTDDRHAVAATGRRTRRT